MFGAGEVNFYRYANADPVNYADVNGLEPFKIYPDKQSAAISAIDEINSKSQADDIEYAGSLCQRAVSSLKCNTGCE